ncbi:bZIP transcription factor family protein [Artemisia annua]|uniref:BZIP transcription factor family protein n=1 Tax=Artemisia annua TaxID=35608 RepID=A0A2U1NQ41_ARTAN|nr:bZIP transcription factor family protein [Artemisia annua]
MRPPTLNIFPSQPMHVVDPSTSTTKATTGLVSPSSSGSRRPSEPSMDNIANPQKDSSNPTAPQSSKAIKTLRRLAQNREAARKSRLRKKAYVQQLESSRIKLTQLEQELQRARAQVIINAAVFDMEYARWLEDYHRQMCELQAAVQEHLPENELRIYVDNCIARIDDVMNLKSIVAKSDVFHIISGTWKTPAERCFMWIGGFRPSELIKHLAPLEKNKFAAKYLGRTYNNMRRRYDEILEEVYEAVILHVLQAVVWLYVYSSCVYDELGIIPNCVKKLLSVTTTSALFLIGIVLGQIEPLTEQQLMAICEVQQATQEAEEALSQGLDALNQSLSDTIASDALSSPTNMANYMGQMAAAMNKLSALESFVLQADNLRRQTIHHVIQLLTTRQAARSLLAVAEHFHRLRSLSSLWVARPRQD